MVSSMDKSRWKISSLQAIVILILILGFYIPIAYFFLQKNPFSPTEIVFQWKFLWNFLLDSWNLSVIWFSIYQAFWSAVISILLALPTAWILSHYQFKGKRIFQALSYLPFVLPSILVILGVILFFGNQGVLNRSLMTIFSLEEPPFQFLYSFQGILIAHAFYNFPLAMKIIADQWEKMPSQYRFAAQSLGTKSWQVFFKIDLPLLLPAIRSAFILIFILCLNSFVIILVLGDGLRFTTIEVLIYQLAQIELNLKGAASLSFLQILISMFLLVTFFQKKEHFSKQSYQQQKSLFQEAKLLSPTAFLSLLWLLLTTIFFLGPLLSIIYDSLLYKQNNQIFFSFHWYQQLFSQ
ncbi:MAG: thiamine transport system permease protein, partial [bacterium]